MAVENGKGQSGPEQQQRSLQKRAVDRLRRLLRVQDLAADAGEAYRPGQQASAPAAGAATSAQDLDDLKVGSGAVTATAASVRSVALHTDDAPEEEPWKGLGGGVAAGSGGAAVSSGGGMDAASGAAIPAGEAGARPAAGLSGGGGSHGGGDSAPLPPLSSSGSTAGLATEDGQLIATGQVVAQGGWNAHVLPGTFQGKYGLLVVDPSGHWTYRLDNGDPAVQHLNNGQQVQDHFQCMVVDGTGKQLPVPIVVGVSGTDDAAVITGAKTGSVTEDLGQQQASGQLTATDIDNGDQPSFVPQTVQGTYGTFALGADGHWSYTADPQK
ncbi:MAG: hypothetical protein EB136_08580, partial [Synechococcaceae bacterium WBB_3_034]|nr:hypothetical protein [Synechococcaceae bacterium WBB_3_034]